MTQTYKLRKFIPDDISSVLAIADECGLSRWSRDDYNSELTRTDSFILSAETDDEIVIGFIVSRFVPGSGASVLEAEIYNIGVTPRFHGRGVGSALIETLIKKCVKDGVTAIWLDVRAKNARAIDFYERHGFSAVMTRKNFYTDPADDGIVMQLDLRERNFKNS